MCSVLAARRGGIRCALHGERRGHGRELPPSPRPTVDFTTDANLDTRHGHHRRTGLTLTATCSRTQALMPASRPRTSRPTGALTLNWQRDCASAWQTALRAVTYSSTSEDPTGTQTTADRAVSFVISDGDREQRRGDAHGDGRRR